LAWGWLVSFAHNRIDPQLGDIVNALSTSAPGVSDINSVANDAAVGVGAPSYTADENHNRSSIRDHLRDVEASSGGKLTFAFDTLATRVALCSPGHGQPPRAYGVAIAPGAALAVASNFHGKRQLTTKLVTVRYEVIVSAGVFQSPQLVRAQ
jgi:choline dehydrogenase